MKKTITMLLLLSVFMVSALGTIAVADAEPMIFKVGMMAKDLKADDKDGNIVDILKEAKGSKSAIVFMNTACSACLGEVKFLVDLLREDPKGKKLFIISVDYREYSIIESYRVRNGFDLGIWLQDADFAIPPKFGFMFTPAMVILGTDGMVVYSKAGYNRRVIEKFESEVKTHWD